MGVTPPVLLGIKAAVVARYTKWDTIDALIMCGFKTSLVERWRNVRSCIISLNKWISPISGSISFTVDETDRFRDFESDFMYACSARAGQSGTETTLIAT